MDASESTPDRTNLFPPTLSNPATILPGVAATLGEGGMDGSVLPGAGLLGLRRRLRCCSTSEAILSLLHVRGILPERGTSPAAAVELAGRVSGRDIAWDREGSEGIVRDEGTQSELLEAGMAPALVALPWSRSSWNRSSFCSWRGTLLP